MVLRVFPFLGLLLIGYNVLLAFGNVAGTLSKAVLTMGLPSGAQWVLDVGDLLLLLGLVILYVEILKATRTASGSALDHGLSMAVFIVFLVEFITVESCGNSVFLLLGLMSLLDVVAGFTVSIAAARRDFGVSPAIHE